VTGVIEGGWEFVVAAYAVSAVVLFGYAAAVWRRYEAARARAEREAREEQP
jgi:heme exporter protein CcmD